MSKWTRYMDMHSGGDLKLDWKSIYIEAPEDEADIIFEQLFDRDPYNITCLCCGPDYEVNERDSLAQATGFERNCLYVDGKYYERKGDSYREYYTLDEYKKQTDILILTKEDIKQKLAKT